MPIYEYKCEACRRTHEVIQKLTDPPLESCPVCGSAEVEKAVSLVAIVIRNGVAEQKKRPVNLDERRYSVDGSTPPAFRHPSIGFRVFEEDPG
jgi:putative FmdB family regulatory protein